MSSHTRVEAIDLNPMHWLGDAASAAVGDVWQAAMTGLWSAALWLLQLAFKIIDAFTTPDLSAQGPMGAVLPTTLWIGATLAGVMMFVQLTMALVRRDGQSIGRLLIGIGQFGLVWIGYLGLAAGFVTAAAGLQKGILEQMLNVDNLSSVPLTANFPTDISDVTLATVLGVLSILIVIPAAFFYVLIMFVREAALIILVATAPISAGGLISDVGKVWFWKTLRWFFSCLLISPMAALLLGIGVKIGAGIITGTPPSAAQLATCTALPGFAHSDCLKNLNDSASTASQAGMAVIGCIIIAIGACCPLILFRLLAFVEPGTASGAALRQSWSDAGGMSGVMSGGTQSSASSAATQSSSDGRSGGESGAESQTQSRLSAAMGAFGTGMQVATSIAHKAADIGSDILGQAGVGSHGYSMTPTDERSSRRSASSSNGPSDSGGNDSGSTSGGGSGGGAPLPEPPASPGPGGGSGAEVPGGAGLPGGPGGTGGAGAAGGSEAAVAVVAL
jgi:type IV secretion system protein TrbL